MTMTPQIATNRIIREIHASEKLFDLTIAASANLLATVSNARVDSGEVFGKSQVAVMRLVRSISALSDARAELARTHTELRKIADTRCDIVYPDESQNAITLPDLQAEAA